MVGRALRGVKAGGTPNAYIVSFIDNWNEHIAWVNPESLFEGSNDFFDKEPGKRIKRDMMLIAVSKIEEFARLLSGMAGPLENVPFMERIPLGMYTFSYEDSNSENQGIDYTCEVMVYNSTEKYYQDFINYLPNFSKNIIVLTQIRCLMKFYLKWKQNATINSLNMKQFLLMQRKTC